MKEDMRITIWQKEAVGLILRLREMLSTNQILSWELYSAISITVTELIEIDLIQKIAHIQQHQD